MDALLAAAEADNDELMAEGTIGDEVEDQDDADATVDDDFEEVDDRALTCKISEFFPQDNKLCYRIESENQLAAFQRKQANVVRKFEDFQWLHERLSENGEFAGVLIPYLPPKVTWTDVEEAQTNQKVIQQDGLDFRLIDQFQRRALQLQRFLRYVCRHTKLRQDDHLVVFMEYEDELRPKITTSWFDQFTAARPTLLPVDKEGSEGTELAHTFAWTAAYKAQLEIVARSADDMSYASRMLAAIERETVHELHTWKLYPGVGSSLTSLARGLARSQLQHHVRAQIEDSLYDLLMDYTGLVMSIESMFARRYTCFQSTIAASKAQKKAQANESKAAAASLKAGGKDPAHSRHLAAKQELQDATAAETAACTKIRDVSQRAKDELTLAKRRRAADFKAVFVRLAEHEIQTGIKRREEWSEVLLQLKSDIDEADN